MILDLGLGQRGLFHRRPHDGLGPLIERAVHHELHELLGDHRLGVEIHGQIGIGPVAGDAQALELLPLDIDPAFGELAAFLAEGDGFHLVLVQALGAVLLLDLPFDRQAVAIPAGDIAGVLAHHLLGPHHHVLQDLVQRVADVQVAVGIGGAVVQREGRPFLSFRALLLAQAVIDADPFPARQPVGFALRQARAHRKVGFGQEDGIAIVGGGFFGRVGAHLGRSLATDRDLGAARWLIRLVPAPDGSGRRAGNSNDDRGYAPHARGLYWGRFRW